MCIRDRLNASVTIPSHVNFVLLVSMFLVEAGFSVRDVEDQLVGSLAVADATQCVHDVVLEALALVGLVDDNVFHVSCGTAAPCEFLLKEDHSISHDFPICRRLINNNLIKMLILRHLIPTFLEVLFCDSSNLCELCQHCLLYTSPSPRDS
eukprot:TRINITY_DN786_c0_g1_i12.p1 TRINITY_DN786_c0_g1~~TRINITY_DN786_c0_g1_i12.p1  ORF type:complete len:151 (-),score=7.26 TRINITY_DN786_c0_g1_i12:29-481(-)